MEAYSGEPAGGGGGERGKGVQPVGVSVETLKEGVEALGVGVEALLFEFMGCRLCVRNQRLHTLG